MCDAPQRPGTGWRGWRPPAASEPGPPAGGWIDLTWPLGPDVPRLSAFPPPTFGRFKSLPDDPFNVTEAAMVVHLGTHVDAPRHFFDDGPAFDEIPLERLIGRGVVWQLESGLDGVIEPDELERMRPRVEPGDIVVLDTGTAGRVGTPDYHRHPSLSRAAAEWLVDHDVKLVAVDASTPELPLPLRGSDFDFPAHRTLLRDGVLIAEQVTNVRQLAGGRAEFLFLALNVVGGDGAPARVLARPMRRD
jgi:kynurenine formamidase